jgi:hypothetical protein
LFALDMWNWYMPNEMKTNSGTVCSSFFSAILPWIFKNSSD